MGSEETGTLQRETFSSNGADVANDACMMCRFRCFLNIASWDVEAICFDPEKC